MIKLNTDNGKWYCAHRTSLPNEIKDWEMKPYQVKQTVKQKDAEGKEIDIELVIEEGYACPKCHRVQIETKKEEI